MAINGLSYNSTANGTVVFDAKCGVEGVKYGSYLYACVSANPNGTYAPPSSFSINGVTWTVPTRSDFSTVCKSSGQGRTIGQTLEGLCAPYGCVICSDGIVYLYYGGTLNNYDSRYPVVAYRTY